MCVSCAEARIVTREQHIGNPFFPTLGLENEVGYKFCQCCVCEEGCLSGTGEAVAVCQGVTCFDSGEVGDQRRGFLTPTASNFDA